MEDYWIELARHSEGYTLFYSPQKQGQSKRPQRFTLKLMRPAVPGHRIKRRVWLSWNCDKQQLACHELADELPEIYGWVWEVMQRFMAREQHEAAE
jgi:hypothetical protein